MDNNKFLDVANEVARVFNNPESRAKLEKSNIPGMSELIKRFDDAKFQEQLERANNLSAELNK